MNHQDLERELPFYVNGTLDAETAAQIERELPGCESCADELAEIRTLRDALREHDTNASDAPPAISEDVFRRIGSGTATGAKPSSDAKAPGWNVRRLPMRTIGGLGLATAAGLVLVLGSAHHGAPNATANVDGASYFAAPQAGPHYGEDVPAAPPQPVAAPAMESRSSGFGAAGGAAPAMDAVAAKAIKVPASMVREAQAARTRKLARTGDIGLIVPDVAAALAKIDRLANDEFGTVTALEDNSPTYPGATHTAQITVSIPSDRFDRSIEELAALGGITSRNVKTEDLTDAMVDTEARLRNLRHEEADLVKIMDRQGKVADILDVEQQLATTRESIEQLDSQDKAMENRVSYSTIEISLTDEKHVTVAQPGPGSELSAAWSEAVHSVGRFTLGLISNLLYLLVYLPYIGLVALLAWLAYRKLVAKAG